MTSVPTLRFLLAFSALAVLAAAGCAAPPASDLQAAASGDGGSDDEVKYAPDFELRDLDGNVVRLSDSAGQVRLIDFWATWCAPCIEEIPMFKELHELYGEQGFKLLAVAMDEEGDSVVREVVDEFEIPYVNVIGNDELAEQFGGVLGLPTAFLVDGEGRIVKEYFGPKPKKRLESKIRELLGLDAAA